MIECSYCGEEKEILVQMPVVVVKGTVAGEAYYQREGFKSNGKPDNICFDCLKTEAEEVL
jgi:hypothetical protein